MGMGECARLLHERLVRADDEVLRTVRGLAQAGKERRER